MIRVVYGAGFPGSAEKLPRKQQQKLAALIGLLQHNPFHPKLHTKQLVGDLSGFYSFRITRDWRVVFQFHDPETIQLLRVRHRKDVYH